MDGTPPDLAGTPDNRTFNEALRSYKPFVEARPYLDDVMSYVVGSHPAMTDAKGKFVLQQSDAIRWAEVTNASTGVHALQLGPFDAEYAFDLQGFFKTSDLPVELYDADHGSYLILTANAVAGAIWTAVGEEFAGRSPGNPTSFFKGGKVNPEGVAQLMTRAGRDYKGVMSGRPEVRHNLELLNEAVRTDFPQQAQLHWEFRSAIDDVGTKSLPEFRISGLNLMQARTLQDRLERAGIAFQNPPSLNFSDQSFIIRGMNNMLDPVGFVALRTQLDAEPRNGAKGARPTNAKPEPKK